MPSEVYYASGSPPVRVGPEPCCGNFCVDRCVMHRYGRHNLTMPENNGVPPGTLVMLVLRVLQSGPLHGYAIAQRIHALSTDVLQVEEGSLYPALQRILIKGWAKAQWGVSETNRRVRFYQLTPAGRAHLAGQVADYERVNAAILTVLRTA